MPNLTQNMQAMRSAADEVFEISSSGQKNPFRFHPHPLRSNPTYPLPNEETDVTTTSSESNQAESTVKSSCSNETCTYPQSSDLIQCVAFDTKDSEEPSLQSAVSQPDQLTIIQTADRCSPLLCHERVSSVLNDQRATAGIRRYSSQPTLPSISNRSSHLHKNSQCLEPTRKELRIVTTMDNIDTLGKRRPQDLHNPHSAPSDVASSFPLDLISGLSKELVDKSFLADSLFENTDHVSGLSPLATTVDKGREGRCKLSVASSWQGEQMELNFLKSLITAREHLSEYEGGKRQGNVFSSNPCLELKPIADFDKPVVVPVPDRPIKKLEAEQQLSEPTKPKNRVISMQGELLDLTSSAEVIESPSNCSKSIPTGQRSPSAVSTVSSNTNMMQQSHWSPVSPIAVASHKPAEGCADDHLGMIVFDDIPKIQLQDRKDWPLPAPEELDAQSLKTFLIQDANDANVRDESSNISNAKIPIQSEIAHEQLNLRRHRTGFIMQKRSNSTASLQSQRLTKGAELPGPAMMLLRNAGRAPSCSDTRTPPSGSPIPFKDMSSITGSVTRKFHLQRDIDGKRSVAVMTPVSEAWDMLTGGVGSDGRRFSSETFRSKLKTDVIGKSWLRWEFKGGLVGQA